MKKTAVILFNLGGPDSKESIEPFLFNFFMDKNIVRLPQPFRYMLAKKISSSRSRREANDSYKELGFKSPLLDNTRAQAKALEEKLGESFKVFVCMRYWHPMAGEVAREVKEYGPEKIVLLPLYPQFSTTTTRSSFQAWEIAAQEADLNVQQSALCCYPFNQGFVEASAQNIKAVYESAQKDGHDHPRILFSAHGLPEKIVRDGDPYQWQCEQAAEKIAAATGIESIDWQICYQSRVGRLKWITPSLDEALEKAAHDNKAVIIYPHAFTQEHVETLVELDIEYKHMAEKLGLPGYYRAGTVGAHPSFIEGLAKIVEGHLDQEGTQPEGNTRLCPHSFQECLIKESSACQEKAA